LEGERIHGAHFAQTDLRALLKNTKLVIARALTHRSAGQSI